MNPKSKRNYIRAALAAIDPFGLADALVVRRDVVHTGIEVKHEHQVSNSTNDSFKKSQTEIWS